MLLLLFHLGTVVGALAIDIFDAAPVRELR